MKRFSIKGLLSCLVICGLIAGCFSLTTDVVYAEPDNKVYVKEGAEAELEISMLESEEIFFENADSDIAYGEYVATYAQTSTGYVYYDVMFRIVGVSEGETSIIINTANKKLAEYKVVVEPSKVAGAELDAEVESGFVTRVYGADRYSTSLAIAELLQNELGNDRYDTVIVASGENFPDALSGSYLATKENAPILLVNERNCLIAKEYIENNLVSNGKVYILGGSKAVSDSFEDMLEQAGYDVDRLAGATRYDTNLEILNAAGATTEEILVCSGESYADSLSAAASGLPILLVDPDGTNLTKSQDEFLKATKHQISIIGGEGAVNAAYEELLELYDEDGIERVGGKNRYETSAIVAAKYCSDAEVICLAYGESYADGLCGAPLAYATDGALVLVKENNTLPAKALTGAKRIETGLVFGGSSAVSDNVVTTVFNLKEHNPILEVKYVR